VSPPGQRSKSALRDGIAALLIFALAVSVRFVFLEQIRKLPFLRQPVVDGQYLDAWARELAAGNWLGSEVFYQAPGYPYFLGAVYAIFGDSLWRAHQIQMLLGSLSCVVMYFAASRFFDRRVGVVAAVLLALYPPALFFDAIIQKASLGLFLVCLTLLFVAQFQTRPSQWRAAACGLSVAALSLTRENCLIFLIAIPVWMAFQFAENPRPTRLRWVASFVLSAGLLFSIVVARNHAVGGSFVLTSSNFGTNFYTGNHAGANGLYVPLIAGRQSSEQEFQDATDLAEAAVGRDLSAGQISESLLHSLPPRCCLPGREEVSCGFTHGFPLHLGSQSSCSSCSHDIGIPSCRCCFPSPRLVWWNCGSVPSPSASLI
jgi:hypothetical protein